MKTLKHLINASLFVVLLPIAFASQSFADNRVFSKDKEQSTRTGSSARDQNEARDEEQRYKNKSAQENTLNQKLTVEQQKLILIN